MGTRVGESRSGSKWWVKIEGEIFLVNRRGVQSRIEPERVNLKWSHAHTFSRIFSKVYVFGIVIPKESPIHGIDGVIMSNKSYKHVINHTNLIPHFFFTSQVSRTTYF